MKNTTSYNGFVQRASADTNSNNAPNHFLFSGVEISSHSDYACQFHAIRLHGFVSPEQFGEDVDASDGALPGTLELFEPDRCLGRFKYYRPDGSGTATADVGDSREYRFQPQKPHAAPSSEEPLPSGSRPGSFRRLGEPKTIDPTPGGFDFK